MGMTNYQTENVGAILKAAIGIEPQSSAAGTVNGGWHSLRSNRPLSCVIHGQTGQATGTPTTQSVTYKLQDAADDGSGSVDAGTAADFTGGGGTAITADSSDDEIDVDLKGARDYVRVVGTVAFTGGSTPEQLIASTIVFGGYHKDQ